MKLTDISLKRRVAVTVLSVAAAVAGFFSLTRLAVDYLPEITYPMVKIHIYWRGATPEEMEANIAKPVEQAMATVDNLDYLDGSCIEGMYTLLVNFQYGVNVDTAYQDVLAVMGRVNRQLPDDMDPPVIIKADPSQLPVMEVTIASDERTLVWLREWVDTWLVDRLSAIPGTAGAEVVGGLEREIRVHLDPVRLTAFGLSPAQVVSALRDENRQIFAGRITVETREIIARTISNGGTIISRGHLAGDVPGVKAHLECRGLILNGGDILAIPELHGKVDGVDMSHEAAVGKINQDEILYLMSRGLSEDEATATIVRGFMSVDIPGLPPDLKSQIDAAVAQTNQEVL